MSKGYIRMSDIAAELGVSRAYISMIASGKRKPSKDFVNKLEDLGVTAKLNVNNSDTNSLTLNQQVRGSSPLRVTIYFRRAWQRFGNIRELPRCSSKCWAACSCSPGRTWL